MDIPFTSTTGAAAPEILDHIVGRYFAIDSITHGDTENHNNHRNGRGQRVLIARYDGHLITADSAAAYDEMTAALQPYSVMPLFRKEGERQVVLLVPANAAIRPSNPWVNVGLYILTVISVLLVGTMYTTGDYSFVNALRNLWSGWPYGLSIMAILTAHEFGHYLAGRYHRVHLSLPYFIPLPYPPLGTMGAVINLKEQTRNRRVLLDIGIAGPLAGLVVAIPILLLGLSLSSVNPITPPPAGMAIQMEGNSILYLLAKWIVFHRWLPTPVNFGGLSPFLYWIRYFFTGQPFPIGGLDVNLHPVAWAGWVGILVTSLNLIPAGQLDGGHLVYVLIGRERAKKLYPIILLALAGLGFIWSGWWLWFVLIFIFGRAYDDPMDQITPLDPPRRALAILGLVIFVLVFIPVPITLMGG